MRLKDRVALITGASGGLGKNFCQAFLNEGAKVCVTDITKEMVDSTVAELDSPGSMIGAVMDVCERPAVEAAVSRIVEEFGRLDILVNVADLTDEFFASHTGHKIINNNEVNQIGPKEV